jgi:D-threo-aldose 1-dehydrogenase
MTALVTGVRSPAHLEEYPALAERTIPADLWADLRAEGLIRPDAPTPA